MKKVADWIVDKRNHVMILYLLILIVSAIGMLHVNVNYDMSQYLPKDSSTKLGMEKMSKEYGDLASITVMFDCLSKKEQTEIKEDLASISNVKSVVYLQDDETYQKDGYSKYTVAVSVGTYSKEAREVLKEIRDRYQDYEIAVSGAVVDNDLLVKTLIGEIPLIAVIVVVIIFAILFLLCDSWAEPFLYMGCIGVAILINMGTNALLPSVSFMTFAVGALLQLGLSMDYSIMLMNRYSQEKLKEPNPGTAMKKALIHAFGAITSSSVTTIVGLLILVFMSFKIGQDMGIVLAKGVFISLICIFTLLPGLVLMFDKLITKTHKKSLNFKMDFIMKAVTKGRFVLIPVVIVVVIFAVLFKDGLGIDYVKMFDNEEQERIETVFGVDNQVVLLYRHAEDQKNLAEYIRWLEQQDEVNSVQDYSNTIGKKYTYKELAEDMDMTEAQAKMLYQMYKNSKDDSDYEKITMYDLICYLDEQVAGNPAYAEFMTADQIAQIKDAREELEDGRTKIADAEQEMDDGEKELSDGEEELADGEAEIAKNEQLLDDSEKQLLSGEAQIAASEKQLLSGEVQIAGAEVTLAESEKQLSDGESQIEEAETTLAESEKQLSDGETQIEEAEVTLAENEKQLSDGEAQITEAEATLVESEKQLSDGETQIAEGETTLAENERQLSDSEAQIADARKQMLAAGMSQEAIDAQLAEQEQALAVARSQLETGKSELQEKKAELQEARRQLEAGKKELLENKAELQEGRKQLEAGKKELQEKKAELQEARRQLEAGKKELLKNKTELKAGRKQLESGKTELAAKELELLEGKIQLQDGKQELSTGSRQLTSGRSQLEDAKQELEEGKEELSKGRKKLDNGKTKLEESKEIYEEPMTVEELADVMGEDVADVEEMLKMRRMTTLDVEDDKMSLEKFVRFITKEVLTNETYADAMTHDMRKDLKEGQSEITDNKELMLGDRYNRMMISLALPLEGDETFAFIGKMEEKAEETFTGSAWIVGDSTMGYEMDAGFSDELNFVTILTIVSILAVVIVTFRSFVCSATLVAVIQAAVYIVTAIAAMMGISVNYIALILVQCILMGSTIDYGILFISNYKEIRWEKSKREAVILAMNHSMKTIMTSSLILISCCLTVGFLMTQKIIAQTCSVIACGALCAVILVIFLLPALAYVLDRFIVKKENKNH